MGTYTEKCRKPPDINQEAKYFSDRFELEPLTWPKSKYSALVNNFIGHDRTVKSKASTYRTQTRC